MTPAFIPADIYLEVDFSAPLLFWGYDPGPRFFHGELWLERKNTSHHHVIHLPL